MTDPHSPTPAGPGQETHFVQLCTCPIPGVHSGCPIHGQPPVFTMTTTGPAPAPAARAAEEEEQVIRERVEAYEKMVAENLAANDRSSVRAGLLPKFFVDEAEQGWVDAVRHLLARLTALRAQLAAAEQEREAALSLMQDQGERVLSLSAQLHAAKADIAAATQARETVRQETVEITDEMVERGCIAYCEGFHVGEFKDWRTIVELPSPAAADRVRAIVRTALSAALRGGA